MSREIDYLHYIIKLTNAQNKDNISRTKAYQKYYFKNPEIRWALLASVVSRNAGWNMTDLATPSFKTILGDAEREHLFMTYERANWLIFSDAYPQLLIYSLSKRNQEAQFHLLKHFHVSTFMMQEWYQFWKTQDKNRLMNALIINEQNVIEKPVIQQPFFKREVFHHAPYLMQNIFHMSAVLMPTKTNGLHGLFVKGFTNVSKRIMFGKNIASILFSTRVYPALLDFITKVEHTGSRCDYERYMYFPTSNSPMLRRIYPIITHQDKVRKEWYRRGRMKSNWIYHVPEIKDSEITNAFRIKRVLLDKYANIKNMRYKKDLF
ncbi:DUF2515 family protein [Oceanobacillus bengalensis]|uniref:DUF2515 domain-containing protein n=1 Tax=Oceanobacillus bengalensis TaxID=1435466 RepID=A0A494YW41_9BACI|nr:DUF2515 family protein [Oceanobacillus bengalensis]RKQ13924.1 DUF2515 domain-containing protein [Oceanobacillus bengalensis]